MSGKGGVAVAHCDPGHVDGWFHSSVTDLLLVDSMRKPRFYMGKEVEGSGPRIVGGNGGTIRMESGPRIGSARNYICRQFLERFTCEWLWMVDADMRFRPDVLDTLMDAADPETVPIVGGLCFAGGRAGVIYPTIYQIVSPETNNGEAIKRINHYPENTLMQVDGTGAACLLIHRTALEKIEEAFPTPAPWFMETMYRDREYGEDWTFCLRAGKVGLPIHVHTGAKIGHMKRFNIDEELFQEWLEKHEVEAV